MVVPRFPFPFPFPFPFSSCTCTSTSISMSISISSVVFHHLKPRLLSSNTNNTTTVSQVVNPDHLSKSAPSSSNNKLPRTPSSTRSSPPSPSPTSLTSSSSKSVTPSLPHGAPSTASSSTPSNPISIIPPLLSTKCFMFLANPTTFISSGISFTKWVGATWVNDTTFVISVKTLASSRELNKCVELFHLMNGFGIGYCPDRLNKVVGCLCRGGKLVEEAKFLVLKLKEWVCPDRVTYGWLIKGFCDVGDMVEASKVWNLMVDQGFDPEIEVFDKMIETFFKKNEDAEAMKVFQVMRLTKMGDLGLSSYRLVIDWMCRKGKLAQAKMVFDEMRERGIEADSLTLASLVYGLLARGRVNEAYVVVGKIQKPDISVYHGLIKGLLRMRKAGEATEVFREMVKRGCEPIMHTYVMLLQGHLGKRGRKGPHPLVNFDAIFVGGLVKAGKSLEATKYVERAINGGVEVPRFDYNRFLHYYSTEEGAIMFEEVAKRLREVGLVDLADILQRFGEKMATRDRRRNRTVEQWQ